jgi:8-oxo-dGTP pyrophosphatase MutT (NUDIX family)
VYYRWCAAPGAAAALALDRVPSYATSIEGACAMCLSPDEQSILMTHEFGQLMLPGGAIDPGEGAVEAARREAAEEVSLNLLSSEQFETRLVGGWHQPKSRDCVMNDNYRCFLFKSADGKFAPDGVEIKRAEWVPLARLRKVAALNFAGKLRQVNDFSVETADGVRYSWFTLRCVYNYFVLGRSLGVEERHFGKYVKSRHLFF